MERAKLVYEGVRYFDEDLVKIGKKEAQIKNCKYVSYSISRKMESIAFGFQMPNGLLSEYNLPFNALSYYYKNFNIGEVIEKNDKGKLIVNITDKGTNKRYKKEFTERDILAIGKIVSDDMDALCKSFVVNEQTKSIEYKCVRGGIDFTINVKFKDLNAPELCDIGKILK